MARDAEQRVGPGAARGWGRVRLAAPSWVLAGTIWENCRFLAGMVDEVGLLFFETVTCLAYDEADLPPGLADLGMTWHVHLPGDLPWASGGEATAALCSALMDKVAFLGAERAVLHPPAAGPQAAPALEAFAAAWSAAGRKAGDILLENTRENDLDGLWPVMGRTGLGLCLDLGHMLAYNQRALCRAVLAGELPLGLRPAMVHCNAPGPGGAGRAPASAHLPLNTLDADGRALGAALCALLDGEGVAMAELFTWEHVVLSLPLMDLWLRKR